MARHIAARWVEPPYKVQPAPPPYVVRMARVLPLALTVPQLYEVLMVALLPSVHMVEQRTVRHMAVRFMLAPLSGHGWRHLIMVPSSQVSRLAR